VLTPVPAPVPIPMPASPAGRSRCAASSPPPASPNASAVLASPSIVSSSSIAVAASPAQSKSDTQSPNTHPLGTACWTPSSLHTFPSFLLARIKPRGKGSAPAIKPESQARTATSYHDASTLQSEAQSASSSRGQSIHESADWETGALQPSGLLQHAVSHGQFSLRNILNAVEAAPVQPGTTYAESSSTAMIPPDDPVKLGLVTLSVATELFQR